MKKILFTAAFFGLFAVYPSFAQDAIVMPEGAQMQSLRNDNKSKIYIRGCGEDALKMDNINNLYGNYWSFYLVGTVEKLSDITVKPYGNTNSRRIALRKGCGYVARHNNGSGRTFVRLYVTEMLTNTAGEIIGATLLYQTNYQSDEEKKSEAQAQAKKKAAEEQLRAEQEAAKIFWNGDAVSNANVRKKLLTQFDTDKDGKISRDEAARAKYFSLEESEPMTFRETGIHNLVNLTELFIVNTPIKGDIILKNPGLKMFGILNEGIQHTVSKLDMTGCRQIDTVFLTGSYRKADFSGSRTLSYLAFPAKKVYVTVDSLILSGCGSLATLADMENARGRVLDASGCHSLDASGYNNAAWVKGDRKIDFTKLPQFSEINLSGCRALHRLDYTVRKKEAGFLLEKLNLAGCSGLNNLNLDLHGCELSELNLPKGDGLRALTLRSAHKITKLDLSYYRNLSSLTLDSTGVRQLDLSGMKHLNSLSCTGGALETLNVSGCDSLEYVDCSYNKQLKSINLAGCRNLRELYCMDNALTALDISNNYNLERIECAGTSIQELDISHLQSNWDTETVTGVGNKLVIPHATEGFKTLWVNEKQGLWKFDGDFENPVFIKYLKDKNLDKSLLLNLEWDGANNKYIPPSKADLDFKIKVRK